MKLSGDALYEVQPPDIRAGLGKDFPKIWQYKPEVTVKPAAGPVDGTVCQQLLTELLSKGKIRFEPKRATLDPDSTPILDHLIETGTALPERQDRGRRHTDADGEDSVNQALSEKRAQAVIDYLVKAGLAGRSLHRSRLRRHAAGRRQRHRQWQGAEPPHRISGEVTMAYLVSFHLGWLVGSLLLGLADGLDFGGPARHRHLEGGGARCLRRAWSRPWSARRWPACARPLRLLARPRPDDLWLLSGRLHHRGMPALPGWSRAVHRCVECAPAPRRFSTSENPSHAPVDSRRRPKH